MKYLTGFFKKLLDTSDWPPRWHCGKWTEFEGWLYIISDLLIWSAYFTIPLIIIKFISRKKNQRFIKLYFLFAAFILACGATHFMDAVTFWFPAYRLNALLRAITAIISWLTVFSLVRVLPYAFRQKSAEQLADEIESRKEYEQELIEKNNQLKEAELIGGFGHFEWGIKNNSLVWSDNLKRMYNFSETTQINTYEQFINHMPLTVRSEIKKELDSYIINKEYKDHYRKLTDKHGHEKILFARGKIILDDDGNVEKVIGTVQDVTASKKQEQLLKQSQDTFKNIFEHAAIGMALVSTEGKFIDANEALCKMLGYDKEELKMLNFQLITYGLDLTLDLQNVSDVLDGRMNSYKMEKRYIRKNGSLVWSILSVSLIRDENGDPDFFISQINDITARKEQELELAQSRENLTKIFEYSSVGKALLDITGNWININQALCDMLGYHKKELLDLTFKKVMHEDDLFTDDELIHNLLQRKIETYKIEKRFFKKDGSIVWGLLSASIVWNSENEPLFLIAQVVDITENKKLIDELEQKNHALEFNISQVNEFNRIISHNLRSPATSLITMSEFIESDENLEDKIFLISKIKATAESINTTLNDLKEFVDIQLNRQITLAYTSLEGAIEYAVKMLKTDIETSGVQINVNLGIKQVFFPKVYLESMFFNLLSNAIKYRRPDIVPIVNISSHVEENYQCIVFSDNGIGIDLNKYKSSMFKYKRTFHKGYDSNGVGLFLVKNHLGYFGGDINVESKLDEGTSFIIYLKKQENYAN